MGQLRSETQVELKSSVGSFDHVDSTLWPLSGNC